MTKPLSRLGEGLAVDPIEAWNRIGRELAIVDPERFRKYLLAAEAVVALYLTQDPDRALAERLPLIGEPLEYDA
jgi:hypothetical protein